LKRCPKCGTIAKTETQTCGACGADLRDVPDELIQTAAAEEERAEATDQARLKRKETAQARRHRYVPLTLVIAGVIFWMVAIVTYLQGPGTANFYWMLVLVIAGIACVIAAVDPFDSFFPPPKTTPGGYPRFGQQTYWEKLFGICGTNPLSRPGFVKA
jgi:hypothetical protein